ncbi:MAG TPA: hypothetical protein VGM10_25405 [Actinocrinis sp.]|jgi:hypothetical protein
MSDDDDEGAESPAPKPDDGAELPSAEPSSAALSTAEPSPDAAETSGTDTESAQPPDPEPQPPEPQSAEPVQADGETAADDDAPQHAAEASEPAAEPEADGWPEADGGHTAVMEPVREPETQVIARIEPDTERLSADPPQTDPGTPPPATPPDERAQAAGPDRSNRTLLLFGAVIVGILIIGVLGAVIGSAARRGSGSGEPGTTPAFSIPASGVSVVELDGVAGKVSINTAATSSVQISSGSPAQLGHQFDAATHTLDLSCATSGGNCPAAAYTVTIPEHVGLTLHQISGQTTLAGVSGPISITAGSASTTATGLTATSFTAVITGGELDAAFTGVPQHVSVSVISAQATLHLPGSAQYAVDEQIIAGSANVQIPRVAGAPNVVEANVTSGQITLLAD